MKSVEELLKRFESGEKVVLPGSLFTSNRIRLSIVEGRELIEEHQMTLFGNGGQLLIQEEIPFYSVKQTSSGSSRLVWERPHAFLWLITGLSFECVYGLLEAFGLFKCDTPGQSMALATTLKMDFRSHVDRTDRLQQVWSQLQILKRDHEILVEEAYHTWIKVRVVKNDRRWPDAVKKIMKFNEAQFNRNYETSEREELFRIYAKNGYVTIPV